MSIEPFFCHIISVSRINNWRHKEENMYKMDIQVRYSEVDRYGKTQLHQILEYFQDCGVFQTVNLGFGKTGSDNEKQAWYLIAWDVQIRRYPSMCEKLSIITEPYKMRGFYGYRRYKIIDEDQNIIVEADSIWIFMDIEKMVPVKIPEYLTKGYIEEGVDETIQVKRKLSAKGDWKKVDTIVVPKIFLDSNEHVNNAYYVLWAEEVLPEGYYVTDLKVDYRQAALLNDEIHIYITQEGNIWKVKYVNQEDQLNAVIVMTVKKKEKTDI